jgi:hypothetical protein
MEQKFKGEYSYQKTISDETSGVYKIVAAIDPHLFRGINEQILQATEEDK